MKYKIFIFVFCLFISGCALKSTPKGHLPEPVSVQVEDGTVFLIDTAGKKHSIATSQPEDGTMEGRLNQYTYTKATLSPGTGFIAMYAEGWESRYLRVYDATTQARREVSAPDLFPVNYEWTPDGRLTGLACESNSSFCGTERVYMSQSAEEPWIIGLTPEQESSMMETYIHPSGYTFNYPSKWSIEPADDDKISSVALHNRIQIIGDYPSALCPINFAAVTIGGPFSYREQGYETFDQFALADYDPEAGSLGTVGGKKEQLTINGLSAYKFEKTAVEFVCDGLTYKIQLDDQNFLSIFVGVHSGNEQSIDLVSDIVQSITFNP